MMHWLFLWVPDAVPGLADMEYKAASAPQRAIATAVLVLAGPGFASLWWYSTGWPAGRYPQIAYRFGTGPLRTCQRVLREDHWNRIGTRLLPAGALRCLCAPQRLQLEGETPEREEEVGGVMELGTCLPFSGLRCSSCLLPR